MALDKSIIWGYHGEFWKQGQTNKWNHFYDNGLFVGQFGITRWDIAGKVAVKGMAGNSFSPVIVKTSDGAAYLYHNDESEHGGIHRWKINGLNTIREQAIPIKLVAKEQGLLGQYFAGTDLNNFNIITTRVDPLINFRWLDGKPANTNLTSSENFSVSWMGYVKPLYSEEYTFFTNSNDGVKLWVDGKLLIDKWQKQTVTQNSATITLKSGKRYPIRLEYFQHLKPAAVSLSWASLSQHKQIIPAAQLSPVVAPDRSGGFDLLENLPYQEILQNDKYGWKRDPVAEDYSQLYSKWWSARTGFKSFKAQSPDLFAVFTQNLGNYSISRNLGNFSNLVAWKLTGIISYEGNYPNRYVADGFDESGGSYLEVLDNQGKVIVRTFQSIDFSDNWKTYVQANSRIIAQGSEIIMRTEGSKPQPITITANKGSMVVTYGQYPAINTKVFDPKSNWRNPKTLRLYFFGNGFNYSRVIDIESMLFSVTSPVSAASESSRKVPQILNLADTISLETIPVSSPDDKGHSASSDFVVYPNPVQSMLQIKHPEILSNGSVEIISADGRRIKKWLLRNGCTVTSVNVAFLRQGFYLIKFNNISSVKTIPFIKQ
ncbi:PA14 domain-containing protein [Adhaeribacter pallidiroseus]|uniref:Beta-glucosidase n=1 Tax=Adhaeribacter pallidiroseus TaxID=2072847 RepID=A0A369QTG6_9BACT|nr:PA14 domain-containing protein [Adhaeribacter pallidiroseus]RDC66119.1 Beta-glucosidase [Adhaeribacter pallidiroseus]